MNAAEIIRAVKAEGVVVALSPSGSIKAVGNESVLNRWRPALKDHKAEIIQLLKKEPGGQTARPFPSWCNQSCEHYHRLELPDLEMVQWCCQETDSTHWRWSRLDRMTCCPNKEQMR